MSRWIWHIMCLDQGMLILFPHWTDRWKLCTNRLGCNWALQRFRLQSTINTKLHQNFVLK
ncbi:hypothetical protein AAHE18_07G092900 [Arachis hypogaea]